MYVDGLDVLHKVVEALEKRQFVRQTASVEVSRYDLTAKRT